MSDTTAAPQAAEVDTATYEVLRTRLSDRAAELARRARELDGRRREAFGGTPLEPVAAVRAATAQPGAARDLAPLGGLLLLGLFPASARDDVPEPEDVLAGYVPGDGDPAPAAVPGLLDHPEFRRDFAELHRYYRDARLLRLQRTGTRLLAAFRTGPDPADLRVLRWRVDADGGVAYLDNRGERDLERPEPHDVHWTAATREDHLPGRHPQIAVAGGALHVSTTGGSLTVRSNPDTETPRGELHREPVDEPLQSLADADVEYARVGPALVLLRVRPYKEDAWRYLVHTAATGRVTRLDAIGQSCRLLPEDQGVVFPGGYCLATGAVRTFDTDVEGLEFQRAVRSADGEDVLYAFADPAGGRALLLPYNTIRQEAATPIPCGGWALLADGTLAVLRGGEEQSRLHAVQLWRTPFASEAHLAATRPTGGGPLERIGNRELVQGVADCLAAARAAQRSARDDAASTVGFEQLVGACGRALDRYHWLGEPELGGLLDPLTALRNTARQVLDEHRRVEELAARAVAAVEEAEAEGASLMRRARSELPDDAEGWVAQLAGLRRARGRLAGLRELHRVDLDRVAALEAALDGELDAAAGRALDFLAGEGAFAPALAAAGQLTAEAREAATDAEAARTAERIAARADGLELVTEVVGGLEAADATVRTAVLERIGEAVGALGAARAVLDARRRELREAEGRAAFEAEFALLAQSATGALAASTTPERCEEQLGRLLLRLEGLETRFADSDGLPERLEAKREEVQGAFAARRQALLDERARSADRRMAAGERILAGVRRRAAGLGSPEELSTYFTTDQAVARVRAAAEELRALGDPVRAQELTGRLDAARQEAARALRDRLDLDGGDGTLRLGRHRFAVADPKLELTLVPHGDGLAFAVAGTDYRAPVDDPSFAATRPFWDQPLASESPEVYRGEHLAAAVLAEAEASPGLLAALEAPDGPLEAVRRAAADRYDEGYQRGVHDHDAAAILTALLRLRSDAGLLRHPGAARASAQLYWAYGTDERARTGWLTRAGSLARARAAFGPAPAVAELCAELDAAVAAFTARAGLPAAPGAGGYLFEELAGEQPGFATGVGARELLAAFHAALGGPDSAARKEYEDDLRALDGELMARHQLVRAWLGSCAASGGDPDRYAADLDEAVAVELIGDALPRRDSAAPLTATVEGLLGTHPRISGGTLRLRLDELLERTRRFREQRVPAHRAYQRQRAELVAAERWRLRLDAYRPRPLGGFVRNRLIDEVYLPLIGDNLAKQLGTAGDAGHGDRSGLLMLISPPGYGKTTLMEYVAAALGLVLVRVDGPALGHRTTSLDPAEAPDATARQEVEKINFALELGNNVLLYLDDIQHTSPELLQKFIPLCDAQRRIDGVQGGLARSHDLRGKRFAVCMAGNPYTESGRRFRIPDMLANRADVWNLGDVLAGREDLFAASYLENALTANPVLAPLAGRDPADLELLTAMAQGTEPVRTDRTAHPYPQPELEAVLAVLRHLLGVREVLLASNRAYIASAATADASRTEPPYLLQGSYRDMSRLAGRIVPVMDAEEVEAVLDDHYRGEAQALGADAEANLLKLAGLRDRLTAEQAARWAEVKAGYLRERALGGSGDDALARAVGALGLLADRVGAVEAAITRATERPRRPV
ncbi:DNA repair ATPase [Peterkaempfera bronchialis]|uniref:DNA repair ATPase n=1 Tax=Peterkaempfera bronchialis TaxID=2126346 RepID=UPI003C2EA242